MFCHADEINGGVFIDTCQDPVYAGVFVDLYYPNYDYFFYYYNQSEMVEEDDFVYTALMKRNASHLGFMVSSLD